MIILDTNVISELIREAPDPRVKSWIDSLDSREVTTTVITVAELLSGAAIMPQGRKRDALEGLIREAVATLAYRPVEVFDLDVSEKYAVVLGKRHNSGSPIGMADAMIASICMSRKAVLATRNVKDFGGLDLTIVNPWKD